jgi:hypothetical protein
MYGFEKGSFVGSNFSSGGCGGGFPGVPQQNFIVTNRESNLTPFNYDDNSLMNFSNSPSMYRSSNLTNNMTKAKEDKQLSSGRRNNNRATTSEMGRILEERNEEQDESMLLPSVGAGLTTNK